jgi:SAM-dependent methyltransferase
VAFGKYSSYYDLINCHKNYAEEAEYVARLIRRFSPDATHLLELGCGTGNHAAFLSKKGFSIIGIERSRGMAEIARRKGISDFTVIEGDIAGDIPEKTFDGVIALFHVISYLTENDDLRRVFANAARALDSGGIFVFDTWFTPAVRTAGARTRVREFENREMAIRRKATPYPDPTPNTVAVLFDIEVEYKKTKRSESFSERHLMRHFSLPEISALSAQTGFEVVLTEEFLTAAAPDTTTWGICFVLQKQ